jgi:hypothetical protein
MKRAIVVASTLAIMFGAAKAESHESCRAKAYAMVEDLASADSNARDGDFNDFVVLDRKLREEVEVICPESSDIKAVRYLVDAALKQSTKAE